MIVQPSNPNIRDASYTPIYINTKNNNFLPNVNFFKSITDPNLFSFATHNVRSCFSEQKLRQIETFYNSYNFDILGLSETHLTSTQAFYLSKNFSNKSYKFLFYSKNPKPNCQGIGFIVKNYIYDHIASEQSFFDRVAMIDLHFKNRTKLRIIQIYLPTNIADDA